MPEVLVDFLKFRKYWRKRAIDSKFMLTVVKKKSISISIFLDKPHILPWLYLSLGLQALFLLLFIKEYESDQCYRNFEVTYICLRLFCSAATRQNVDSNVCWS